MKRWVWLALAAGATYGATALGQTSTNPNTSPEDQMRARHAQSQMGQSSTSAQAGEMQTLSGTVKSYKAGKKIVVTDASGKNHSMKLDESARVDTTTLNPGDPVTVMWMTDSAGKERVTSISTSGATGTGMSGTTGTTGTTGSTYGSTGTTGTSGTTGTTGTTGSTTSPRSAVTPGASSSYGSTGSTSGSSSSYAGSTGTTGTTGSTGTVGSTSNYSGSSSMDSGTAASPSTSSSAAGVNGQMSSTTPSNYVTPGTSGTSGTPGANRMRTTPRRTGTPAGTASDTGMQPTPIPK